MQTSTQPQAPAAPAPAPTPGVSITTVGPGGATQTLTLPMTRADVDRLLMQRQELSDQLSSVTSRRSDLSEAIRNAPEGASRSGLEDRIRILDQRILQLETDLATVGQRLSSARADIVSSTEFQNSGGGNDFEGGMAAGSFSTLFLAAIAFLYARRRRKRRAPARSAQIASESSPRFERLEQGMEAIAIEIERVSEGQRFLTKLLSEAQAPAVAAHRIAQPLSVERDDPTRR